jgi:hypothetical protein
LNNTMPDSLPEVPPPGIRYNSAGAEQRLSVGTWLRMGLGFNVFLWLQGVR